MFGGACTLVNVNVYLCRLSELCVSLSVVDVMFLIGIERSARKTPVLIYSSPFGFGFLPSNPSSPRRSRISPGMTPTLRGEPGNTT